MINTDNSVPFEFISVQAQGQIRQFEMNIERALTKGDVNEYSLLIELLGDLQNEVGLYEEARRHFSGLLCLQPESISKARLNRKIAHSHTLQKTYLQAPFYIEEAERILLENKKKTIEWHTEYISTLLVKSDVLYYGLFPIEKIIDTTDCIKGLLEGWGNEDQKLQFYKHILFIAYRRYRFYGFPDEMLSHALYYRFLAEQKRDEFYIADSLENLAFIYLWRNELRKAIETYKECIDLLKGKQSDLLMIAYNYIALAYRMSNRIPECEDWTNKAYQLTEKMNNSNYLGQMLGNFGWLNLKRNNELYAENYFLKGFTYLSEFRHPFLWITCIPLIAIYAKRKDWENAGKHAHCLLHPVVQKLPDRLECCLKKAVIKWQLEDWKDIDQHFDDVITEAQLSHYF
jgi:tetratricopeptide (TPR) repeat protein